MAKIVTKVRISVLPLLKTRLSAMSRLPLSPLDSHRQIKPASVLQQNSVSRCQTSLPKLKLNRCFPLKSFLRRLRFGPHPAVTTPLSCSQKTFLVMVVLSYLREASSEWLRPLLISPRLQDRKRKSMPRKLGLGNDLGFWLDRLHKLVTPHFIPSVYIVIFLVKSYANHAYIEKRPCIRFCHKF